MFRLKLITEETTPGNYHSFFIVWEAQKKELVPSGFILPLFFLQSATSWKKLQNT